MTSILVDASAALDIIKEASPPAMKKLVAGLETELSRLQQIEKMANQLVDFRVPGNEVDTQTITETVKQLAYIIGHQEYIRSIKD